MVMVVSSPRGDCGSPEAKQGFGIGIRNAGTGFRFRILGVTRALLALLFLLLSAGSINAQTAIAEPDRAEFRRIIEAQIQAFRRDDGVAAFAFASPAIQDLFGTPDNFLAMVRAGYPAIYRPRDIRFTEVTENDGQPLQLVQIIGPDGVGVVAAYQMTRLPGGSWRINGCTLLASPQRGV
jgi:hypothetical protein